MRFGSCSRSKCYPPNGSSFRTYEGSHWVKCSISHNLIPQRRVLLRTSPRGPIGLSALFYLMLLSSFWFSPGDPSHLWCGGWWVDGGWRVGSILKWRFLTYGVKKIDGTKNYKNTTFGLELKTSSFPQLSHDACAS